MSLIEGLKRQFDDFQLDIARWELADEGVTALIGPSGSGKTTVFRTLIGLEPCPGLSWKFHGEDLALLSVPAKRLGVVFQSLELFPHMTAQENILFAARARQLESEQASQRLAQLSEELRLQSFLQRRAGVLSGGEAQRVALARAVIGNPRFLFLDEPFSALDTELRAEARRLMKSLIAHWRIPTLLITHDQEDLSVLASHIVKIRAGKLV